MATNPMKRRERNAFLIGMLITLLIMGAIVAVLVKKYSEARDALEALKAREKIVYVAGDLIESGTSVNETNFMPVSVLTEMTDEDYYTDINDLLGDPQQLVDEHGDPIEADGEEDVDYGVSARIDIPRGAIVTKSMFAATDDVLTDDIRIQEYNTMVLPSQLKNGDFIDVRIMYPNGQDFIILSKKEVVQTDETTAWLKVNELELLMMNSAMVDTYLMDGAKLYAIEYVDPGMQLKSDVTYRPTNEVVELIEKDPNIVTEAKTSLAKALSNVGTQYREAANEILSEYIEDRDSKVEAGINNEIKTIQEHRSEYVEALKSANPEKIGNQETAE